jgi:hypothetical protein
MTNLILASLFAAAVLVSGAAYADGSAAPAMAPSVATQTIIGVAGGETYPQFGPATTPVTSRPMTALNGEQYPRFNGSSGTVSTQRMIAQNGQNYPEFSTPPQGGQNHAYAQAIQPPAVPHGRGAARG